MWDLLVLVLDSLHMSDIVTKETSNKVKLLREHPEKAAPLLAKIKSEKSISSCIKCGNRFFCSLFLACIYYALDDVQKAHVYVKQAIRDFELGNLEWNATLASWVYGEMFMVLGHEMPAHRELSKTIKRFRVMDKEFRWDDKYEARDKCVDLTSKIQKRLENPDKNWDGTTYYDKKRDKSSLPSDVHPFRRSPPSSSHNRYSWKRSQMIFPVHNQIRAGTEGNFIFESEPDLDAILDEMIFNDERHFFYNLRDEGNSIVFKPRVYRWFRIEGNSLNQAEPIAIMDGDYVLVIDLSLSNMDVHAGDIVVANLNNPSQHERAGIIKKYTYEGLKSQSSDEYQIVPLKDANIRGLAIAVAKSE